MNVQIIAQISGLRNGIDWPPAGGTINLPDAEASDLIAAGIARGVDIPETAVARKPETATRKGAPRKVG